MIGLFVFTHVLSACLLFATGWVELSLWAVFAPIIGFWFAMAVWLAVWLWLMYLFIRNKDVY